MEIVTMLQVFLENWQNVIVGGVMLAWSVIFITGLAKKLGLSKIKNEHLKKAILFFGSLAMVLPTTALYLLIERVDFKYYWCACLFTAVIMIITYAFYENTGFRALVHSVGERTVGKVFGTLWFAFRDKLDNTTTVKHLTMTTNELKEEVRRDLRGLFKEDHDLTDL